MICEHDRLARQCRECANIDDIAELESAHKMMLARNERLEKEVDELAEVLRFYAKSELYDNKARELKNDAIGYWSDISEDSGDKALKVLRKYGLEGKEE